MIFLSRSDSWIDYVFEDIISKLIDNMLCIIMLFESSIYSDNRSRITSTIINIKSFIISRFWKIFLMIIISMSGINRKYAGIWFSVLFMISNASNNFCLLSSFVKCLLLFTPYCDIHVLTQWLKRKMWSSWNLNVAYWKATSTLIVWCNTLIFVIICVSSQKSILWYDVRQLLTC